MKKLSFSLFAMISLCLVNCNKDGDIIIDNPDSNSDWSSLSYSILDYTPAPGQYINENVSGFANIKTMREACQQAKKRLSENQYVSLGAWGGYMVIKADEPIYNSGNYDFAIASNTFDSSNEPGIVWVMQDLNGNSLPDDVWYELKGSYYAEKGYERNYSVTYFKPAPGEDTPWTDSNGDSGFINWMGSYHNQDYYYPEWILEDSYTLYGSRLPSQTEQNPTTGIWTNLPFKWGYVDNSGEDMIKTSVNGVTLFLNQFKISDAVDEKGNFVSLSHISFIKVQTAINGKADILGENSTEICGFYKCS